MTGKAQRTLLSIPVHIGNHSAPLERSERAHADNGMHPPGEPGDPFQDWHDIRLPPGTAGALIDRASER